MLQPFVSLQSNLLLCWHDFCDVNVTLSKSIKVDSLCTAEVDSTELANVLADIQQRCRQSCACMQTDQRLDV